MKDEIAQGFNRILNEVKDAAFLKLDKQFLWMGERYCIRLNIPITRGISNLH